MSVFHNYLKFIGKHPAEELTLVLRSYEQYKTQLYNRKTNKKREYKKIINNFDCPQHAEIKKVFHQEYIDMFPGETSCIDPFDMNISTPITQEE